MLFPNCFTLDNSDILGPTQIGHCHCHLNFYMLLSPVTNSRTILKPKQHSVKATTEFKNNKALISFMGQNLSELSIVKHAF